MIKTKSKIIYTMIVLCAIPLFAKAQSGDQDVYQRAQEVSSFFEKHVPDSVKNFVGDAVVFLEGKRVEINQYSLLKVESQKPLEITISLTEENKIEQNDVKNIISSVSTYFFKGLYFVSSKALYFWGILGLVTILILRRFFR